MSYSYSAAMIDLIDLVLANLPVGLTAKNVDTPNGKVISTSDKWARLSFTTLASENITPTWLRDECIFSVDLFYPQGKGVIQQMQDAEQLRKLIENSTHGNAIASKALINDIGKDGSHYHIQLQQTFHFEGKQA